MRQYIVMFSNQLIIYAIIHDEHRIIFTMKEWNDSSSWNGDRTIIHEEDMIADGI